MRGRHHSLQPFDRTLSKETVQFQHRMNINRKVCKRCPCMSVQKHQWPIQSQSSPVLFQWPHSKKKYRYTTPPLTITFIRVRSVEQQINKLRTTRWFPQHRIPTLDATQLSGDLIRTPRFLPTTQIFFSVITGLDRHHHAAHEVKTYIDRSHM